MLKSANSHDYLLDYFVNVVKTTQLMAIYNKYCCMQTLFFTEAHILDFMTTLIIMFLRRTRLGFTLFALCF